MICIRINKLYFRYLTYCQASNPTGRITQILRLASLDPNSSACELRNFVKSGTLYSIAKSDLLFFTFQIVMPKQGVPTNRATGSGESYAPVLVRV